MKKTITFLLLVTMSIISLTSCKKETVTNTVLVTDNSVMGLLTQKQWEVDTLYYNFTGPGTGTLEYARGAVGNLLNEDDIRDIYWKDGTADYFDNSGTFQPNITWSFNNSDSSALLINSSITLHGKILRLDATHYNFFDSTSHAEDVQVYKP